MGAQCFWVSYNWVVLYIYLLSDGIITEGSFTQMESVAPVTEQKTMKLTFEMLVLITLSIFKQIEDASRICIHHDFKKQNKNEHFLPLLCKLINFSNFTQYLLDG